MNPHHQRMNTTINLQNPIDTTNRSRFSKDNKSSLFEGGGFSSGDSILKDPRSLGDLNSFNDTKRKSIKGLNQRDLDNHLKTFNQ